MGASVLTPAIQRSYTGVQTVPTTEQLIYRGSGNCGPFCVNVLAPSIRPPAGQSGRIIKGEIIERLVFNPNVPVDVSPQQIEACQEFIGNGLLRYVEKKPAPEPPAAKPATAKATKAEKPAKPKDDEDEAIDALVGRKK